MKCLNCKTEGKHYIRKICPVCTSKGIKREDIVATKKTMTFIGSDASPEAGKFVNKIKKDGCVSHIQFNVKDLGEGNLKVKVDWLQYEHKSGGTDGGKKANKSK
jgi:hypothetical protein